MRLFASGVAALAVSWGVLYAIPSGGQGEYSALDRVLVHEIAFVFAFAAVVMVISRRSWTFRAVGLFLTSVGTAFLYGLTSTLTYGVTLTPGQREAWLDLARAGLGLGGLLVFVGLVIYLYGFFNHDDVLAATGDAHWKAGDADRRDGSPGRRVCDQDTLDELARYRARFGPLEGDV